MVLRACSPVHSHLCGGIVRPRTPPFRVASPCSLIEPAHSLVKEENHSELSDVFQRGEGTVVSSVVISKPANGGQAKTGQRSWSGTKLSYPDCLPTAWLQLANRCPGIPESLTTRTCQAAAPSRHL